MAAGEIQAGVTMKTGVAVSMAGNDGVTNVKIDNQSMT